MRNIFFLFLFSGAALLAPAGSLAAPTPEEQLGALLKAHPELILDVLRDHSEQLLDIVQQGSDKRRRMTLQKQWESDMKTPKSVILDKRPVSGPANAPVTIVAFSDFLCSYCHQAAFTLGDLMTKYKGRIRLVFKLTPKTETGRLAGSWFLAAYATMDKAKAWKLYALMFDRQQKIEADPLPALRATAAEAGLDAKALEAAVQANAAAYAALMDEDAADAHALGFVGTPYFLVNDLVIRGALPLENFIDATELALSKAQK
ncbi:MAG: thioredoxin domain-containing protein [Mailhella sp.]|nr:thioredoxin domain-containing protein [Mailhella sp.]